MMRMQDITRTGQEDKGEEERKKTEGSEDRNKRMKKDETKQKDIRKGGNGNKINMYVIKKRKEKTGRKARKEDGGEKIR